MTAPQQLALDEAHNAAYTVEYGATGHLYRIALPLASKHPSLPSISRLEWHSVPTCSTRI